MDWVYLLIMTFIGATIQSATGFGFGLMAVPVFLLILDSTAAIQMVMVIILCMSILDGIKLRGQASIRLLIWLSMGMVLGFPFGIMLFQRLDLSMLKLMIALIILLFCVFSFYRLILNTHSDIKTADESKNWKTAIVGVISGVMTTSLGMPGPSVMMYLVQQPIDKTIIRATILTYFIFAYAGALVMQSLAVGISSNTWIDGFLLVPVALAGVMLGHAISPKINQHRFKQIILSMLVMMSFVMLFQV